MKEAQITCLCNAIALPDLGLALVKGETAFVDAQDASRSKDLLRAKMAKGVRVTLIERVRQRRLPEVLPRRPPPPPPPPSVIHPTVRPGASATPRVQPQDPLIVQAVIDMDGIRKVVREEVTGAVREAILKGMGPVSVSYQMGVDKAVPGADHTAKTPTFIPTGIVKSDSKAEIAVEASETDASGIEAAAKALKGRKRSPRKRGEGE